MLLGSRTTILALVALICALYPNFMTAFAPSKAMALQLRVWGTQTMPPLRMANALDGDPLELCEENAILVIDEIKKELGTIFGYDPKSREVGITGEIEFVECDGPSISVSLSGRFWHATDTVMMHVESYVQNRIPEVIEVTLDRSKSSIQDDNRLSEEGEKPRLF